MSLKEKIYSYLIYLLGMVRKELIIQLTIYAIFIGVLMTLTQLNITFNIFHLSLAIPSIYFWSIFFVSMIPLCILMYYETYKEEYDLNHFYRICKAIFHLIFLAGLFGCLIVVFYYLVYVTMFIFNFRLSIMSALWFISAILVLLFIAFRRNSINLFNPFSWVTNSTIPR